MRASAGGSNRGRTWGQAIRDIPMIKKTSLIETFVAVPLHSRVFMPKKDVKKERGN